MICPECGSKHLIVQRYMIVDTPLNYQHSFKYGVWTGNIRVNKSDAPPRLTCDECWYVFSDEQYYEAARQNTEK